MTREARLDDLKAAAANARRAARSIPGVRRIESLAASTEHFFLSELKHRLELLDAPAEATEDAPVATARWFAAVPAPERRKTVAEQMKMLLALSTENTPADSQRALLNALVRDLVPDEARIIAALADGSEYAMVHIAEPGIGTFQKRVLENASSVGRAAGVALPARTHIYVSHLRRLGLVESGPEDASMRDEYEILLTDPTIRSAISAVNRGPLHARVIRRTVKISELGRELWEAAQGSRGDADRNPSEA